MRNTGPHQAEDSSRWEVHRQLLRDMFQGKKLEDVMKYMAKFHGFHAA
jgi:hypothetical protein